MPRQKSNRQTARPANRFRIIGGAWRGRRLAFPADAGIRPSPDRVRETLFNWLAPLIDGARCLDLFAGSGALGLEALSRGAGSALFVERNPQAAAAIDGHLSLLNATGGRVVRADAVEYLRAAPEHYDVVFLDPPFRRGQLPRLCRLLQDSGCLNPAARVYLELEAEAGAPALPPGWVLLRSGRAGAVGYHLAEAGAPGESDSQWGAE